MAVKKVNNLWHFTRNSKKFRAGLGLVVGDGKFGHHIIPFIKQDNPLIQKAVEAGFDLNNAAKNGKALKISEHSGSHLIYSDRVEAKMNQILSLYNNNPTPAQARQALENLASQIKTVIEANPGVHIDNLIF